MDNKFKMLGNKYIHLVIAFLIGGALASFMYPTKKITKEVKEKTESVYKSKISELQQQHLQQQLDLRETFDSSMQEYRQKETELSSMISTQQIQISELKQKTKEKYYKIIKPDGTIIEETLKESETEKQQVIVSQVQEEFDRKVKSIESKWEKVHRERVLNLKQEFDLRLEIERESLKKEISERVSTEITEINTKNLGLEIGITKDKTYYGHGTYTLFGPFFIGGGLSTDESFIIKDIRIGVGIDL